MFLKLIFLVVLLDKSQSYKFSNLPRAFLSNKIVPDVIDHVPKDYLLVSYPWEGIVDLGETISPSEAKEQPLVHWPVKSNLTSYYTLMMVDPDVPVLSEINHWLVGNIQGNDLATGESIAEYTGPMPPIGTGIHRYVFMAFKQTTGKLDFAKEKRIGRTDQIGRIKFNTRKFMKKYHLEGPVAGFFFKSKFDKEMIPLFDKLFD